MNLLLRARRALTIRSPLCLVVMLIRANREFDRKIMPLPQLLFFLRPLPPRSIFNRYLVDNEDYCTLSYVNISGRLKIFPRNFNTSPIFHLNGSTNAGHNKLCTCPPPVTPPLKFTLHPHPSRLILQQRRPRTVSDHPTQQASFVSPSFAVTHLE